MTANNAFEADEMWAYVLRTHPPRSTRSFDLLVDAFGVKT